ncbi:MAG: hypothetical protein AABY16_03760 [Nanoarchaeota archaeon]
MIDFLLLILAVPIGFLIARLARDELIQGRNYLLILMVLCFVLMIVFLRNETFVLTLGFMSIVGWISYLKSFDSKWAVERRV